MVIKHTLSQEDASVTKVDLTTWKSHPLGGNLFAAESDTTARTTTVNQFEAANERVMGGGSLLSALKTSLVFLTPSVTTEGIPNSSSMLYSEPLDSPST